MRNNVRGNTLRSLRSSTVYLDTSAWNALCDTVSTPARLRGPEYLFSSCNLDEFGLAHTRRAAELAEFAWRISNRRKLLDHLELTAREITARHSDRQVDYFDSDPGFEPAWRMVKSSGITMEFREYVEPHIATAKREYQEWLQLSREVYLPIFENAHCAGLSTEWPAILSQFEAGAEVVDMIRGLLEQAGLKVPGGSAIEPWTELPGTACWIEYHLALRYLAAFDSGRVGKAERGDQFDFRHACYAAIADVFVTGDSRMHRILSEMVPRCSARLFSPDAFLAALDEERPSNKRIEPTAQAPYDAKSAS